MHVPEAMRAARRDHKIYLFIGFEPPDMRHGRIGPYRISFMQIIKQTGSLRAVGAQCGMTYKQAWHVVKTLNRLSCEPLIDMQRGRNGGTRLTKAGLELLKLYGEAEKKAARSLSKHVKAMEKYLVPPHL